MFSLFDPPLPGKTAHSEMAPADRLSTLMLPPPPGAREAAVLVLLMPAGTEDAPDQSARGTASSPDRTANGPDKTAIGDDKTASTGGLMDWQVLLIRRSTYDGAHSGQVAFPGGKREAGDTGLWHTACRETREETGIRRGSFKKLGELTSLYVPPSNFIVSPFVAACTKPVHIAPDAREVADYRWFPLRFFHPARAVRCHCDPTSPAREVPAWRYDAYTIWGATAMILTELYRLAEAAAQQRGNHENFLPDSTPLA